MKLGLFKTIAEPPMSDIPPTSDYIVAQRVAALHEKFTILDEGVVGDPFAWQIQLVREKLQRELNALLKKYDDERRAYDTWVAAGRPDLSAQQERVRLDELAHIATGGIYRR